MKRKNSTVKPEAGTLKNQTRALRTNGQTGFVKSIAFALFLSLSVPMVSIAEENLADTGKEFTETVDRSVPDSCCVADRKQVDYARIIRLTIPSKEMIIRSDSEANRNLVYSLKENKLNRIRQWILRSDREISNQFLEESRISLVGNHSIADQEMGIFFKAENLSIQDLVNVEKGDEDIRASFSQENQIVRFSTDGYTKADEEIIMQFQEIQ